MKVFVDSIGCRLNQSEIEKIAAQFRSAGHILVGSPAEAELVVVNTCAVTVEAASDSRQKIRQARRAGSADIVVTGCWSTLDAPAAAALPGVISVIPNTRKKDLVSEILKTPAAEMDLEPLARRPLPGIHQRTRAFIKAQDGCNNHCTFCITRVARGGGQSQGEEEVIADVRTALAGGTKEIVLTGVHLGSWGHDFVPPSRLERLAQAILTEADPIRLRFSSLEPWDLKAEFFGLWQDPRVCRHLHLPLQSGCKNTLRRMARNVTPQGFAELVRQARQASPEMAITTDIIVGFPGETEEEYAESLAFVGQMEFSGGHVFNYSARPGTPAARYPNQVPPDIRRKRSAEMRAVLSKSALRFKQRFLGRKMGVLWESASAFSPQGWKLEGLTDNYLRVTAFGGQNRWNEMDEVELVEIQDDEIWGKIV
ncbi:MAG TPA: MiaB/RimO family radical SAM methylthiotransferase [Anaerolineaceae bacterium]|nr:MiaB/RimO family radical SAM methylthiotransferase [Anaerolineaceae bacterium]